MNTMEKDQSLIRYIHSIPDILRYQLITKTWLIFFAWLLRLCRSAVLWTGSRSAVSSGDLPFLMTTPQGWLVILLGISMLLLYMIFDVNAMLLLSSRLIHQEPISVRKILIEAMGSLRRMAEPHGAFLVIYVAFLLPIAGVGLGISLTDSLYIPDFITSVIKANALYNILYTAGLLLIYIAAIYYIFTFHCIVLSGMRAGEGRKRAGTLMHRHWKNFLRRYLSFLLRTVLIGILLTAALAAILFGILNAFDIEDPSQFRTYITFSSFFILVFVRLYLWLFTPFQFMELTRIYETYTEEDEGEQRYPARRPWKGPLVLIMLLIAVLFLVSRAVSDRFDQLFPEIRNVQVAAHRAGGTLANENTVLGLKAAIAAGAQISEIDVQRTKDGYYVLNHDNTLKRLTGDTRRVSELTLAQLRQLQVPDLFNIDGVSTDFALFDEILKAAKDHIHLYVELKGESADQQMAEDLYAMVQEQQMLDEVTFISLNYPLISSLELAHPDAGTGYLCYAALGDLVGLDIDELILEEEVATPENIDRIHEAGKRIAVWTVNNPISMLRFYARNVDAIITDNVTQALDIRYLVRELIQAETDPSFQAQLEDAKRVILKTVFVWWP